MRSCKLQAHSLRDHDTDYNSKLRQDSHCALDLGGCDLREEDGANAKAEASTDADKDATRIKMVRPKDMACNILCDAYRPKINGVSDAEMPMILDPRTNMTALARTAPLRPQRSMTTFATRLPSSPPTV